MSSLSKDWRDQRPRGIAGLSALPVLEGANTFVMKDVESADAIVAWRDEAGSWEPVYASGKWWKRAVRI